MVCVTPSLPSRTNPKIGTIESFKSSRKLKQSLQVRNCQRQFYQLRKCEEFFAMVKGANSQLSQTRDATRRLQTEINTFKAACDSIFSNFKWGLYDIKTSQFGVVEEHQDALLQQQITTFTTQMEAVENNLNTLQIQLETLNERLFDRLKPEFEGIDERLLDIDQNVTTLNTNLTSLEKEATQIKNQGMTIETRFNDLAHQTDLTHNYLTPIQDGIATLIDRLSTIDEHMTSSDHRADIELLFSPIEQRLTTIDQRLSSVNLQSDLDQRFVSFRQQVVDVIEHGIEDLGRQVQELRVDMKTEKRVKDRTLKDMKASCVIL